MKDCSDLSYIRGLTERSCSVIRTDQTPPFGIHVVRRLICQFTRSRNFKPQEEEMKENSDHYSRAVLTQCQSAHKHRDVFQHANTELIPLSRLPTFKIAYIDINYVKNPSRHCHSVCFKYFFLVCLSEKLSDLTDSKTTI